MAKQHITGPSSGPWKRETYIDSRPIECNATLGEDAQTGKQTISLDKTAKDLWDAAQKGKRIKIIADHVQVSEEEFIKIEMIVSIEMFKETSDGSSSYNVKLRLDIGSDDSLFYGDELAESDTVVVTEV